MTRAASSVGVSPVSSWRTFIARVAADRSSVRRAVNRPFGALASAGGPKAARGIGPVRAEPVVRLSKVRSARGPSVAPAERSPVTVTASAQQDTRLPPTARTRISRRGLSSPPGNASAARVRVTPSSAPSRTATTSRQIAPPSAEASIRQASARPSDIAASEPATVTWTKPRVETAVVAVAPPVTRSEMLSP